MEEDLLEDRGHLPSFYGTLKMSAVPILGIKRDLHMKKGPSGHNYLPVVVVVVIIIRLRNVICVVLTGTLA
jgi:hypothetical protein